MTREDQFKSKSKNKKKYKNLSCPNCKSGHIIKRGFRKTENRGKIQRYSCKDCKYRFVKDEGFYRMRNSPQKITLCLDLFFRGISTRKIQEHLEAFYFQNSSWVSIYFWVIKYSKMISRFTDNLKLKAGQEVQVDELEYRRRISRNRKGVEKNFFIDSIGSTTKFIVASKYIKTRNKKEIRFILKEIKNKIENQIKIITTDAHPIYENVVKKTFGYI